MIKPYNEAGPKKEQVREMFERIAFRYDFLNRLLSLGVDAGWRRRTVRSVVEDLSALSGGEILDLAAGTGDLTIALARRLAAATVTGADLSPAMLAVARRRIARRRIPNIAAMLEADAEALPFAGEAFEAVTVGFGVRNFQDIPAGLAEMYRVLKPGGHVYILEFAMPSGRVFGPLFSFYFRRLLPFVGGIFSGEKQAYRYLQRSVEDFPCGERFVRLMQQAGFHDVTMQRMTRGLAIIYRGRK